MTRALEPVAARANNLTEIVFDAIQTAIVEKSLAPGRRVSEVALAVQLNVSKTPVREALLRLRHIGLVHLTDDGLRVVKPSIEVIRAAYEHRIGLERVAAELAARRADPSMSTTIRDAASSSLYCAKAAKADDFRHWDREFHSQIAAACANSMLRSSIADSLVLTSALRVRDIPAASSGSVRCGQAHVAIAEAITNHDHHTAANEMQEHIEHVMSMMLSVSQELEQAPIRH